VFDKYGCDTFILVLNPFSTRCDALFLRGKWAEAKVLSNNKCEGDNSVTSLSSINEDSTVSRSVKEDSNASKKTAQDRSDDNTPSTGGDNMETHSMHFT
jgi:hypothetical protein